MVLVDTQIWIRFLANRMPYAQEMDRLLAIDDVVGHNMIYGELLMGDSGSRSNLLSLYQNIRFADTIPHEEVAEFVRIRNLNGRGVDWVDVHLLASALVGHFKLWTGDASLGALATRLGVAHHIGSEQFVT